MGAMLMKAILASCIAGSILSASDDAKAQNLTEVSVATSVVSMNSSMITAAIDLGYFAQEGLALKFVEFQGSSVVMTQIAAKALPIGTGGPDALVVANQPGKTPLPLKYFYNQARLYGWEMLVLPNGPIKTLADLKGKKIGVGALTNSHIPVTRLMLKDVGLEFGKDYSFTAVGTGGPAFKALNDGEVDAYFTFTSNIGGYESLPGSTRFDRLDFGSRYKGLPSTGFFAHVDTIKDNPKLLIGFGRAMAKATIFCEIAMEYCIKSYWKIRPNLVPRQGTIDENAKRMAPTMHEAWKAFLAFPADGPRKFGEFPKGSLDNMIAILADGGELPMKYDSSILYTNELIDGINQFDVAAVEKQAQSYKQ